MTTEISGKLIPYNNNQHSISEAVFSIILSNKIINPKRFEKLILDNETFKNEFQSFKVLEGVQVQISGDINAQLQSEFKKTGDDGFQFEGFKNGKLEWLIRYQPNQAGPFIVLSVHCLNYPGWDKFYPKCISFINAISEVDNGIFANGFSLNYVDQFDWMDESFPPMTSIFKTESKYIPKVLFENKDVWNIVSNYQKAIEIDKKILENVNIGIQKIASKFNIYLLHNIFYFFEEPRNLKDVCREEERIKSEASIIHDLNKEFMKDILVGEILNRIGINN